MRSGVFGGTLFVMVPLGWGLLYKLIALELVKMAP